MKIELKKRIVYAGDVHIALLKAGWNIREAADFVNAIPSVPVKTHGDETRAMSDEELAWELMTWRIETAAKYEGVQSDYPDTKNGILQWLQSPAEGGAENA